jgi:hypothetical protein
MVRERKRLLVANTIMVVCLLVFLWYSSWVSPEDYIAFVEDSFVADEEPEAKYYDQGRLAKFSADGRKAFLVVEDLHASRRSSSFMFQRTNESEKWTSLGPIFSCTKLNVRYFLQFDVSADGQTIIASCQSTDSGAPGKLCIVEESSKMWVVQALPVDQSCERQGRIRFNSRHWLAKRSAFYFVARGEVVRLFLTLEHYQLASLPPPAPRVLRMPLHSNQPRQSCC